MSAPAPDGTVTMGNRTYHVRVTSETVRRTVYWVSCPDNSSRSWRPGEVRVGVESVFSCLTCRTHPKDPCIHITVAQRFVAAQPLEPVR